MFNPPLRIGVSHSAYPERIERRDGWVEQLWSRAARVVGRQVSIRLQLRRLVSAVARHGRSFGSLSEREIREVADLLRFRLRREGFHGDLVAQSFALIREAAERTIGQRHFDVQLMGGWILLNGMIAEMDTGEGKTITATLPACTAALAGRPVHIITVNDYLARRDAKLMQPIYQALGITVGVITHEVNPQDRRAAYACDVAYCTNKEVAFDYLRDRIVLGRNPNRIHLQLERVYGEQARVRQLLLRGLYYAIVDEADSVLVDEARTPLIISGSTDDTSATEQHVYQTALLLADQLESERDYVIEDRERVVRLTVSGQERLADLVQRYGGIWTGRQRREEFVRQALTAQHLVLRDKHYLVRDGKVEIIDEYTGRTMRDRSWERGLHQLIEMKEGCVPIARREPLARISYQRFFRRYLWLAGMTGTAQEVAGELWSIYRLSIVSIPTNRPIRRYHYRDDVYPTEEAKWKEIVSRIESIHQQDRPILVGTRSVAASEHLSDLLTAKGLPHHVLNARQDQEEAEIIAQAGESGRITVATNMAGRGTDIKLAPGVAQLGGLHVIATERHEARRIDRQLFGRCGRQGDPGSYEALASLDDELLTVYASRLWWRLGVTSARFSRPLASSIGLLALWGAQKTAEQLHSQMRRDLLRVDEYLESALAFSGRFE